MSLCPHFNNKISVCLVIVYPYVLQRSLGSSTYLTVIIRSLASVYGKKLLYIIAQKMYLSIKENDTFKCCESYICLKYCLLYFRTYRHCDLLYSIISSNSMSALDISCTSNIFNDVKNYFTSSLYNCENLNLI